MNKTFLIPAMVAFLTIGCSQAQDPATNTHGTEVQEVVTDLDPAAFQQRIEVGDAQLVDVRSPGEFAGGHIAGAVNMDWNGGDPSTTYAKLDKNDPVLVYCAAGGRSTKAMHFLQEKGYSVQQLADGMGAWEKSGMPVVKD